MNGRRAVIVGGSIGGLFAGNMLAQQGWEVDILERAKDDLSSRGTGIARHLELEQLLKRLGIVADDTVGIDVSGRTAFDRNGKIIAEYNLPQRLGAWNRVFEPLFEKFPREHYHNGSEFTGMETTDVVTKVQTANGQVFEADVVIGADGFSSTIREFVAPGVKPTYGGYVAWRGVSDEEDLTAEFLASTFSHYAFLFVPKSLLIGYPMAGSNGSVTIGKRRYNYLWYYPTTEENLKELLTDNEGYFHENGIPPPLIQRNHINELKMNAQRLMPENFLEAVFKADTTMFQPIYDVNSDRIVFNNIALIGDAAFVARPHVGVGVLKAAQDAISLATSLSECHTISEALTRYENERFQAGKRAVTHGRNLGAFIERGLDKPEDDPTLNLPPERIIRVSGRPYEHVLKQNL